MWTVGLENYSYILLAFGQRQVLLSLCGFLLVVAVTWCWRRTSVQALLPPWLWFWIWMLPLSLLGSTDVGVSAFNGSLNLLREYAQSWLPLHARSPCEVPYVDRFSGEIPLLPQLSWHKLALALWLLVAAAKVLSLLLQRKKLSAVAKAAQVIDDAAVQLLAETWRERYGLARAVSVRTSTACNQAFTVGVLRPVIFLPTHLLQELKLVDIEAVLGHEFAHIKRYDDIFVCFQLVTKSLLFFNPLIWLSAWRIASLRERRCDQLAMETGNLSPQSYAKSLLRVAELHGDTRFNSEVAAGLTSSALAERVGDVLTARDRRFSYLPLLMVVAGLLLLNVIFLPHLGDASAIRGEAAETLFKNLGAVAPMPRLLGNGNFNAGDVNNCGLPSHDYHPGADFVSGSDGDRTVRSIADGEVVTMTGVMPRVGITLKIEHANNTVSTYVHLREAAVKAGDHVRAGESIGSIGDDHLHLEVRRNARVIDPSVLAK